MKGDILPECSHSLPCVFVAEVADNIPSGWSVQGTAYRVEIIPQLEEDTSGDYSGANITFFVSAKSQQ